jgi:hypothetical protein
MFISLSLVCALEGKIDVESNALCVFVRKKGKKRPEIGGSYTYRDSMTTSLQTLIKHDFREGNARDNGAHSEAERTGM